MFDIERLYEESVYRLFSKVVSDRIDSIVFAYCQSDEYKQSPHYSNEKENFLFDRRDFIDLLIENVYVKNGLMFKDKNDFEEFCLEFIQKPYHSCCYCKGQAGDIVSVVHKLKESETFRFNELKNNCFFIVEKAGRMDTYFESEPDTKRIEQFQNSMADFLDNFFEGRKDDILYKAVNWVAKNGKNPFSLRVLPRPFNRENCDFACGLCMPVAESYFSDSTKAMLYERINETVKLINKSEGNDDDDPLKYL